MFSLILSFDSLFCKFLEKNFGLLIGESFHDYSLILELLLWVKMVFYFHESSPRFFVYKPVAIRLMH